MPRKKPQTTVSRPAEDRLAKAKARLCARLAIEKKAFGISVLHVGAVSPITEYFVICSGRSVRQTRAIAEHIQTALKARRRETPLGVEGEAEGVWILLDYDDVVIHVFYEPTRAYYALESLWSDAPRLRDSALLKAEREALAGSSREEGDWED